MKIPPSPSFELTLRAAQLEHSADKSEGGEPTESRMPLSPATIRCWHEIVERIGRTWRRPTERSSVARVAAQPKPI